MKAYRSFSTRQTPQSEPIPGKQMAQNNAGGFSFVVDNWKRLERFLVLGSEGGTYYVNEVSLTRDNATAAMACLNEDGRRVVDLVVAVSTAGRAPKNDPALFVLAMAASLGDVDTRRAALQALPQVARTGTHLFHFVAFAEQFRGWGRGLKRAVAEWYRRPIEQLAYQLVKYRQRDGWSHRDLLRLSHPTPPTPAHQAAYRWVTQGELQEPVPRLVEGFERAKVATRPDPRLIMEYGLTWEMVPPDWLNFPAVWEALLERMSLTAMLRNLGKMGAVGLLAPFSAAAGKVAATLRNGEALRQARVHPLAVLMALKVYAAGHGMRGKLAWEPVPQVTDALNEAFYLSFGAVEPTGKRLLLAVDVSGSMGMGYVAGTFLTAREAAAVMALVTANVESGYHIMGFDHEFSPLGITPRQRLDDVVARMSNLDFGATDCALPMLWALQRRVPVDAFVVYTDSETWYGQMHPVQALREYREKTGVAAKLVVVGMTATEFTIADPDDGGMLDVVGFDTAVPQVMSDFIKN